MPSSTSNNASNNFRGSNHNSNHNFRGSNHGGFKQRGGGGSGGQKAKEAKEIKEANYRRAHDGVSSLARCMILEKLLLGTYPRKCGCGSIVYTSNHKIPKEAYDCLNDENFDEKTCLENSERILREHGPISKITQSGEELRIVYCDNCVENEVQGSFYSTVPLEELLDILRKMWEDQMMNGTPYPSFECDLTLPKTLPMVDNNGTKLKFNQIPTRWNSTTKSPEPIEFTTHKLLKSPDFRDSFMLPGGVHFGIWPAMGFKYSKQQVEDAKIDLTKTLSKSDIGQRITAMSKERKPIPDRWYFKVSRDKNYKRDCEWDVNPNQSQVHDFIYLSNLSKHEEVKEVKKKVNGPSFGTVPNHWNC